jgi:NAD(P)-dependent dehydrogenase (short-subunit alcohol dehydrogenase family)
VSDWDAPDLAGSVAVVTGASRGVGKGIALALGDCGATVYVTGRSTRAQSGDRPGTVDDTADEVTARGGAGLAAPTDHTDDAQVDALFERVRSEHGRLDLLVANAWGGYEDYGDDFSAPFWQQPLSRWDTMFGGGGLRAHFAAARKAAPLMIERGSGLLVFTGGWADQTRYLGQLPYDVQKTAVDRMVRTAAFELREHGVGAVGVYPGFTRTEAVIAAFASGGQEPPPETHSPEFVGRGVAKLAADPARMQHSGSGAQAADLARRYGFTDVDGREITPFVMPDRLRL